MARTFGLLAIAALLVGAAIASVMIGAKPLSPGEVLEALFSPADTANRAVVWDSRIPRTVTGIIVGAALGVCGALIQAYTRNPLADPGILGVNAGATFAITIAIGALGIGSPLGFVWFALGGALIATVGVYLVAAAGRLGPTPEKLTLAGVAVAAVLGGMSTILQIKNPETFAGTLNWGVGSIGARSLELVASLSPLIVVGLIIAFLLARPLNAFALGDDLGRSLGVKVGTVRIGTIAAITLLAGTATAIAGPIAFVGLMVPHAVRWFTGPDQRWIIPYSMFGAGVLLLVSDIIGRVVLPSGELQVGLVTAFIGAPVLVLIARQSRAVGL